MSMDRGAFEALITRMEALAASNPAAYRRRVFGLAILGYGYLLLVVTVLLALCAVLLASIVYLQVIAVKLLLLVGGPLWLVLRSMWVELQPPAGERLTKLRVPGLFQMLGDLRKRLRTPRIHHVLLTPDFNAGVMQVPRLGLLGWHRNYLFIGLPLMKSLTVEQFQAVLAHELGHLSGGHARAGNWIYRLRLIWQRLEAAFSQTSHWGAAPIRAFFKWYIPRFSATSFPLARANEYEADAAALNLTSARSAAQALTAVSIVGSYLSEKYWPKIHSAARELPQPAFAPYSEFMATAIQDVPAHELQSWQETALAGRTSYDDTHPSLADRLKAMGVAAEFAPPLAGDSAERLLGAERARLESAFDAQWRERVAESWKQVHENTRTHRLRLSELRSQAAQTGLDEQKALELADLEEDVGEGSVAALRMRRALVAKYPESAPARFSLARQLLRAVDVDGVALMEALIEKEPNAFSAGAQLLQDYYWRRNERDLALQWQRRFMERANELHATPSKSHRV
ncbi:MAG TPA: M48 family metallopeptidase [Steroidobacteraceae bacterium]|nr:M48 family metallopeptidase [Steroidobacteraceae bacterium]